MAYIGESLAAANMLALVWFLAGVRTNVDSQRASLDEALSTTMRQACIRTFIGVYAVVSLEVRLPVEALASHRQCMKTVNRRINLRNSLPCCS